MVATTRRLMHCAALNSRQAAGGGDSAAAEAMVRLEERQAGGDGREPGVGASLGSNGGRAAVSEAVGEKQREAWARLKGQAHGLDMDRVRSRRVRSGEGAGTRDNGGPAWGRRWWGDNGGGRWWRRWR